MSLHLSPLFGPFVTLFFEKNENFLFRGCNRFVDALKTDAFLMALIDDCFSGMYYNIRKGIANLVSPTGMNADGA